MLSNNCSILLIDDDADVLDAYTQLLEQAGYHVSACNNPFDAREQVPKDWPGIVLSDVCMPGCSGIDLMTLFHLMTICCRFCLSPVTAMCRWRWRR